jgi:hypothetical protein
MGIFNDILKKLRGKLSTTTQQTTKETVPILQNVDVEAVLKQLAEELNVHTGAHGSAEQNIALHKVVMRKIAENGGKVPDSLKD